MLKICSTGFGAHLALLGVPPSSGIFDMLMRKQCQGIVKGVRSLLANRPLSLDSGLLPMWPSDRSLFPCLSLSLSLSLPSPPSSYLICNATCCAPSPPRLPP